MPSDQPNAKRRTRVLIYSDCSFFAGCENMPANLVNDPGISREFEVVFVYRDSVRYSAGAAARLNSGAQAIPLNIPTVEAVLGMAEKSGLPFLAGALRLTGLLLLLKYVFVLYSAAVLFCLFRRLKPDILHINNGGYPGAYSCLAAVFAARAAGIKKIVFVVNSIAVPYAGIQRRLERPIDNLVGRGVSLFVTGSQYACARLRELFRLPANKFVTVPNGIAARPEKEPREAVLRRLGIHPGFTVLGTVAILEPRKGHRYLLEALALVKGRFDRFSEVVLVIEGTGSQEEPLERLADSLGLKANLRFIAGEQNVFDVIRAFDVFILPSVGYEDFPNVILEAMSLGKPVIGTKVAGIPEQVLDGKTGLVVEPADAEGLAGAILRLLSDARARAEMGVRSRERFDALFSYEKAIGNYSTIYRRLMTEG
jgi:glycosyltransferase involved in cell wall biosynthesis